MKPLQRGSIIQSLSQLTDPEEMAVAQFSKEQIMTIWFQTRRICTQIVMGVITQVLSVCFRCSQHSKLFLLSDETGTNKKE